MPERMDRGFLTNLDGPRSLPFLFNPVSLKEKLKGVWTRLTSPGLPYERLQYDHHENWTTDLELYLSQDVFEARDPNAAATRRAALTRRRGPSPPPPRRVSNVEEWRRYLAELNYPRRGTGNVKSASPPAVLFVWPKILSMRVRVIEVDLEHLAFFAPTPSTRRLAAVVHLEEDVPEGQRIYSEDMAQDGFMRPWATASSATGGRS